MATLGLTVEFSATHGTRSPVAERFQITVTFAGQMQGGFVAGMNDAHIRRQLAEMTKELEGKYLNDLIGRATKERLAEYALYTLRTLQPRTVRITRGLSFVEVHHDEINNSTYPRRRLESLAEFRFLRAEFSEAIAVLDRAVALDPDSPEVYNFRGKCHLRLESYAQAEMDFRRSLELDPNYGEAFRSLGNLYLAQRRYEQMLPVFGKAIELLPTSPTAYNNRGFALQALRQYESAVKDHTKALELQPLYAEALRDRAAALEALGRTEDAQQDRRRAQELLNCGSDAFLDRLGPY